MPVVARWWWLAAAIALAGVHVHTQRLTTRFPYPAARRDTKVEVIHGVRVADSYRWLENLNSEETRQWIKDQDALTRRVISADAYSTYRARIDRLANLRRYTAPLRRGNRWFFFETDSNGLSGRVLMVMDGSSTAPRPLLDLRSHGDTLSRVLSPSPDGSLVAFGETIDGSRWLQLKLVDAQTGRIKDDVLDNLHSSMGSIAWTPDGRAFYYVRFDPPTGPRTSALVTGAAVMRHIVGTPQSQDVRVFQLTDQPNRLYSIAVTDDGHWLVVTTSIGAAFEQQIFAQPLSRGGGTLTELFPGITGQFTFLGAAQGHLWFETTVGAPRQRVIRVDPHRPQPGHWVTVIPEPAEGDTLQYADLIADRLIVMVTHDASPTIRVHALSGAFERQVSLPPLGTVWGASAGGQGFVGRVGDREAYYTVTGVGDPGSVYRLDPQTGQTHLFLRPDFGFDPSDFVGTKVFYRSKDGTPVPIFIAHHKSVRADGARAVFMYGYGALKWAAFPWFQPQILAWMEAGGVYALPGLRGGGEYGERWHQAAVREKKQVSVDDYIAAAEWLVENKYAASGKVVANGGSISGVVAAAAVVQRPTLFGAAVIDIPALDLLRYDRHTGAASWIPEFGSTSSPVEFAALRKLSPYHNLDPNTCYPPMLVLAGEKDDIAVPSHAYKFVAALQHSQPCASPALLQVAWGAGHTFGTSNETSADTWARQLAFVSDMLRLAPARSASDR